MSISTQKSADRQGVITVVKNIIQFIVAGFGRLKGKKQKKSMKKDKKQPTISRKEMAAIIGCSPETVKAVRAGKRIKGPKAKQIIKADQVANEWNNKLIVAVKQAVNF